MVGKNNKQKSEEPQSIGFPGFVEEPEEPKVDLEVDPETLEKDEVVLKQEVKAVQPIKVTKEPVQQVEQVTKNQVKIITGEALENNLYRFTVISTKPLGVVGETYEI